ncbi:MAG TPA: sporulation membrane protein YtaF [Negativicutes bacterium]
MTWLMVLGFAISSSVDNLGVGISYGIRNIRIGLISNLLVAVICFVFSEAGISFGKWLSIIMPGVLPVMVGAFLLFIIGIRIILLTAPRSKHQSNDEVRSKVTQPQGITAILENPELADADKSGEIGLGEAIVLGIALSANALTNGLGAGLLNLSPLAISLTAAIGSFLTVWLGVYLGKKVVAVRIGGYTLGEFGTILSGIILLVIATTTFLR